MKRLAAGIVIFAMALALTSLTPLADDRKARELIQSGRNEETLGNSKGATELYKQAFEVAGSNPELAAEAMLRLGMLYERKRDDDALRVFEDIVTHYAKQPAAAEAGKRASAIRAAHTRTSDGGGADVSELKIRTVWQDMNTDTTGRVSIDGRYLSFIDRKEDGALALHDIDRHSDHRFPKPGNGIVGQSAISRDGKYIAYAWYPAGQANGELHLIGIDGAGERLVYSNPEVRDLRPMDWTPAGEIVVLLSIRSGAHRIETFDSNGRTGTLKMFTGPEKPANVTASPDGRFIAYDAPQTENIKKRGISTLSVPGGFVENIVVQQPSANDTVLGWISESKLLFASDRDGSPGVWEIDLSNGKAAGAPPIRLKKDFGEIHSLGTTQSGSVLYGVGGIQVGTLENVLPELARLQLASLQRPVQLATPMLGSLDGIIVKRGTSEPISGADVELTRIRGTASFPLNPGAAEALSELSGPGKQSPRADPHPALAPEVQYAVTGESGRFTFRNLKPGVYRLVSRANEQAYFPARYGQRNPRGEGLEFPLSEGQVLRDAKLEMAPTSVITGRVFDIQDEPLGHAHVEAVSLAYLNGRRYLMKNLNVLTDERGDYRLFGLPPGTYSVAAKVEEKSEVLGHFVGVQPGQMGGASPIVARQISPNGDVSDETYGLVYYGDVSDANMARYIELGSGVSSVEGADIHLNAGRTRSYHIRGILINGLTGKPASGVQIRAVPQQPAPTVIIPFDVTDADGAFDLSGVVEGEYIVFSENFRPDPQVLPPMFINGSVSLEMGKANVENLRVIALAGTDIAGRVSFEGRTSQEVSNDLAKIQIVLNWDPDLPGMTPGGGVGMPAATARVSKEGSFALKIRQGNYRVSVLGIPSNAYVRSMRLGDADVLSDNLRLGSSVNGSFEIVVSEKSGELPGTAVNASGAAMANVIVALVPESPLLRQHSDLYRSVTSDARGRFVITAIPPGSYKLFAWEFVEKWIWQESEFMKAYEAFGKTVSVTEGINPEIQVTVSSAAKSK